MLSSVTMEEMTANVQSHQPQSKSGMAEVSYGAALIGLYILGMACGFAFVVSETGFKTATSIFSALFLLCFAGIIFLWRQDEKLWGETLAGQTRPESYKNFPLPI